MEGFIANAGQLAVFSKCHACQTVAFLEGIIANGGHAIAYCHTCQTGASLEGRSANGGTACDYNSFQAIWNIIIIVRIWTRSEYVAKVSVACSVFCCSNKGDWERFKRWATIEGRWADGGHTVGDNNACQTGAFIEGRCTNAGQLTVFSKCHTCQIVAITEGIWANAGHAVRNGYACQTGATTKGIWANAGHAVRDYQIYFISNIFNQNLVIAISVDDEAIFICWKFASTLFCVNIECIISNITIITVSCNNIEAWLVVHLNKFVAISEGIIANGGHAVGDDYACQTGATFEGILVDFFYAVRDNQICFCACVSNQNLVIAISVDDEAIFTCWKFASTLFCVHIECIVSNITIFWTSFGDVEAWFIVYFYKFVAIIEGLRANGGHAVGNGNPCNCLTSESVCRNWCHSIRYDQLAFNKLAINIQIVCIIHRICIIIFKRYATPACYISCVIDICKTVAIIEGRWANGGHVITKGYVCYAFTVVECSIENIATSHCHWLEWWRDIIRCACCRWCAWTIIILRCCNTTCITWRAKKISQRILICTRGGDACFCSNKGDRHTFKWRATTEGFLADACYTVGDDDACQTGAIIEGILANGGHVITKGYVCYAFTVVECSIENIATSHCHWLEWWRDIIRCACCRWCAWTIIILRCCNTTCITWRAKKISQRILICTRGGDACFCSNKGDCHTFKWRATTEGRKTYARHAIRDCYACQTGATIEGIIANGGHTVGDDQLTFNKLAVNIQIICITHRICSCTSKCYATPLFKGAKIIHICQTEAIWEGIWSNGGHTVRDGYTCQTGATVEGIWANAGQFTVFTKCHTCQTGAFIEGIIANGGHTVRDGYACQTAATIEGIFANGGHAIRDGDARQTGAIIEGIFANGGHAIRDGDARQTGAIIEGIFANGGQLAIRSECHTCQTSAVREGTIANGGYTVRDGYACQAGAIFEGIIVDFFYVVRDNQICLFSDISNQNLVIAICVDDEAIFIGWKLASTFLRVNVECIISNITIAWTSFGDVEAWFIVYFNKFVAISEGIIANGGHTVGDDNACQTVATTKGILVDRCYIIRDGQFCFVPNMSNQNLVCTISVDDVSIFIGWKIASTLFCVNIECIISNITIVCTSCNNIECWLVVYFNKFVATTEGIWANGGHTVGDDYACQTVAITEGIIVNGGNAVRDANGRDWFVFKSIWWNS